MFIWGCRDPHRGSFRLLDLSWRRVVSLRVKAFEEFRASATDWW